MSAKPDTSDYLKQKIYTISHPGISHNEMIDGYQNWCKTYDKDFVDDGYSAPRNAAVTASRYFDVDKRKDVKVLDVGAGTGLVGDELQKLGFWQIDALDALKCMLDVAREKGVYKNYYEEYQSATEPSSIPERGLIFISAKKVDIEYLRNFNAYVEKLVGEGRTEEVDGVTHPLYLAGSEGICYVLRVL